MSKGPRMIRIGFGAAAFLAFAAATASAQDSILLKGGKKAVNGVIATESIKGVNLKAGDSIPGEEIDDVFYDLKNVAASVKIGYRSAHNADRDSLDPAKENLRKKNIAAAMKEYDETIPKVTDKLAKRHLEYRIVALRARQAIEDGLAPDVAATKLSDYAAKNPNAWQAVQALKTAARIQVDLSDYANAEKTYLHLAELDLPADLKLDYELQSALLSVQAGKFEAAMKKLQTMAAKLPKGSRQAIRAQVAQAECLANNKKIDEAINMVKPIIKDVTDKGGKAAAYNTLGYCYFQKEDFKQARWEFLWVDVVYNQDRNEHAKALYYLAQTFEKLNEPEQAQLCREALTADKAFAGTDWLRRIQKAPAKAP